LGGEVACDGQDDVSVVPFDRVGRCLLPAGSGCQRRIDLLLHSFLSRGLRGLCGHGGQRHEERGAADECCDLEQSSYFQAM